VIPWSPLARGRVTRPWDERKSTERAETDQFGSTLYARTEEADQKIVGKVQEIAEKRGVPMAQIALAWMLQKDVVTSPIIGATRMQHLEDAVAAISIKLTPDEIQPLEEPYIPHPVMGFG
jgi:1-deoxyxylulose-5-phosphate synthase